MSSQSEISFKLRKRTQLKNKEEKIAREPEIRRTNKRRINEKNTNLKNNEVSCSVNKITKKNDDIVHGESNSNLSKPLPSREKEIEWLTNFLTEHLEQEKSTSLYISGQPGTGKTASLSYVLQLSQIKNGYKQVYINCIMRKSATSIYKTICEELQLPTSGSSEKACLIAIENFFSKKHKMTLLVLDEIDQLSSRHESVLYNIFEWPSLKGSRLVLVGVANALDLTQRALPRLQTSCSLRPYTLHFAPYTKEQIANIFTTILAQEDNAGIFSPVALQMLAAKIAAISGDMRRALDIGRRVIHLAERNKLKENRCIDTIMNDSTATVELKQVLEVLNDVYGTSKNIETSVNEEIPLQQKLILCTIMLILTKGKSKEILMGKLHDVYKRVAKRRNIAPLELVELCDACTLLAERGAVSVVRGARADAPRTRRLRLCWDRADLAHALADKPLLSNILADTACLQSH